jgi:hypothetical protein
VPTQTAHEPSGAGTDLRRPGVGPPVDWTGLLAPTDCAVVIPDHIDATNPRRVYDLDDPAERKYLYEVVLADGTSADINRLVARSVLLELWDRLYLSQEVQAAWAGTITALRAAEQERPARTSQVSPSRST